MTLAYINGKVLEGDAISISPLDLGFLRGEGVFEHFRTYAGELYLLKERYNRLVQSGAKIGIEMPYSLEEVETAIRALQAKAPYSEITIRFVLTSGVADDGLFSDGVPTFVILVKDLEPTPSGIYRHGISAITTKIKRIYPEVKSLNYLPRRLALAEAKKQSANEALYTNDRQEILEATTSNFFGVADGVLITPEEGEILPGITRRAVLEIAKEHFPIEIRAIPLKELSTISEAFLTSSIKEIVPLTRVNGQPINGEEIGPVTGRIMTLYRDACSTPQLAL